MSEQRSIDKATPAETMVYGPFKTNFIIDDFGWVQSKSEGGGMLKTQSVEAQLLLAILIELQEIRNWGVRQNVRE